MSLSHHDSNSSWYAVQVWATRERQCAQHLRIRGYEVFFPTCTESHRWSDRVKRVERAMFAGYVFCHAGSELVGRIVSAPGVIRIVSDGVRPLPVPLPEIAAIQRLVASQLTIEPWPFVKVGERVRIDRGPLQGAEGVVVRLKNGRRLVVSIDVLQKSVAVEIDSDWLAMSAAAHSRGDLMPAIRASHR